MNSPSLALLARVHCHDHRLWYPLQKDLIEGLVTIHVIGTVSFPFGHDTMSNGQIQRLRFSQQYSESHAKANLVAINKNMLLGNASLSFKADSTNS